MVAIFLSFITHYNLEDRISDYNVLYNKKGLTYF